MAEFTLELLTFARAVFTWAAKSKRMSWPEYNARMRSVLWQERRLIGCEGKEGHLTFEMAEKIVKARHREGRVKVYRCRCCRKWHIGNFDADRRRALQREIELRELRAMELA